MEIVTLVIAIAVPVVWLILTVFSQYYGESKTLNLGKDEAEKTALIVYNPDPFYNLDEQVCLSFAKGLIAYDFKVRLTTTQAKPSKDFGADVYVFCTNTYNWAPDWLVMNYIDSQTQLSGKPSVAITLGAGSTDRAKRKLKEALHRKKAEVLASESYWFLRPNDEEKMEDSNTQLANEKAKNLGDRIGKQLTTN